MLGQGEQQNDAMISDDGNSGFMGLWISDMFFFFFASVFGSSSHGFFGV